jgi:hypothetical protein
MLSLDCHIHVMILEGEILTFYKVPIDLFVCSYRFMSCLVWWISQQPQSPPPTLVLC